MRCNFPTYLSVSTNWNQLSCGFPQLRELRTSKTRFVVTTIGLCDSRAQLVLGTCVIKERFAKPLLGLEKFLDMGPRPWHVGGELQRWHRMGAGAFRCKCTCATCAIHCEERPRDLDSFEDRWFCKATGAALSPEVHPDGQAHFLGSRKSWSPLSKDSFLYVPKENFRSVFDTSCAFKKGVCDMRPAWYPLVNYHNDGKSRLLVGKSIVNGYFQ